MQGRASCRPARLRTRLGGLAGGAGIGVIVVAAATAAGALMLACGVGIRRDYSTIPAGQVGFDDLCGLQDYFDTIEAKMASPPTLASALDIEGTDNRRIQGGKNQFTFETSFQLQNLRRVLDQNWSRLPPAVAKAERIDVEVHWSEKAGVKRVVTDTDAALLIGREEVPLPYHVCLSELLYGEPLYRQRREMTGRPLLYRSLLGDAGVGPAPQADGGAVAAPQPVPTPATPPPGPPPMPLNRPAAPPPPTVYDGGPPASARPIFRAAPPAQ